MLDIQGNHDVFNVKDNELYRKYGHANLEENQEYYSYKSINSDRVYNFIPVVAARYPGLKKPHNFIGKVQNLETLENTVMAQIVCKKLTSWKYSKTEIIRKTKRF